MITEEALKNALAEAIKYQQEAAVHQQLAAELNYKASRILQGVSTPGTLKKLSNSCLSDEQIIKLRAKRDRNTKTIYR